MEVAEKTTTIARHTRASEHSTGHSQDNLENDLVEILVALSFCQIGKAVEKLTMEEEEARLKLLLEQTSDYDERKKIRADLRTLRQKKLDVLNTAVAAESSERAARRAERARARKAEQSNGDASTAEKESSGVVISEQILAEIDDEETLQKLLNEIPTSQIEDRRRIRARIREVKRKKTEGDQPSSRSTYSRKTEEVTVTSDEPSGVTVQTTIETSEVVTNHYGGDEESSFKLSLQQSKDVEAEESNEDISEQPDEASVQKVPTEGNIEAIEEQQNEIVDEQVSDTEQKDEEPEFIEPEGDQEDETMRDDKEEEIVEPLPPPPAVEDTDDIPASFEEEKVKESEPVEVNEEEMKDVNEEETKDGNEQLYEGTLTFKTDDEICVQVKIDEPIMVNIQKMDEEVKTESKASTKDSDEINETVDDNTKSTQGKESPDGPKPALKDDVKPAPKSALKGSRWPPAPADEKAKKPGRINTNDFRGNLKKSGKIGTGVVNLENRNSTTGAQVDFRGGLKQTGKSPSNVKLPSRGRGALKKHEDTGQENGDQKDATSKTTKAPKEVPAKPAAKEEGKDLAPEEPPPVQAKDKKEDVPQVQPKAKKDETPRVQPKKEPPPVQPKTKKDNLPPVQPKAKKDDSPASPPVQPKVKKDDSPPLKPNGTKDDLLPVEQEVVIGNGDASPAPKVAEKEPKVATKDKANSKVNKNFKLFQNLSNTRTDTKDKQAPPAAVKGKVASPFIKSQKKAETPTNKAVNGVTLQVKNTSLATKESTPAVKIEVTEHVEDEGDTKTEVKEVNTTKEDDEKVEEKKEVTKVSKTSGPAGGQVTTETKETTTKTTTKKSFVDPELQKRMAARQRERFVAKKEQASSAKNKRMAFMQKLEANSPEQKAPSNIKRSGSNVDKLLAWCRFKTRDYEGIKLSNFSSSWGDGLAFCALLHLYLPDKIPYEELRLGNDRRRNFEVAFGAATEAGVAELLEVDDMLSVANPEPKSVMTYVSSIYKHFNPS